MHYLEIICGALLVGVINDKITQEKTEGGGVLSVLTIDMLAWCMDLGTISQ
jgi:hypothetical protein